MLIPGVREQAQLLRLLRLARIVRLVRFLPDARILILTVIKSIPSLFSMVVLTVLLLFVYGMVGWSLFGEALPENWGTIGRAMLTLFILLTLENFPTYLAEAELVSPYAVTFFVSYVLIAAFVVFNLLIGIVIGSMERARESDAARTREDVDEGVSDPASDQTLAIRIRSLREDLAALEEALLLSLEVGCPAWPPRDVRAVAWSPSSKCRSVRTAKRTSATTTRPVRLSTARLRGRSSTVRAGCVARTGRGSATGWWPLTTSRDAASRAG